MRFVNLNLENSEDRTTSRPKSANTALPGKLRLLDHYNGCNSVSPLINKSSRRIRQEISADEVLSVLSGRLFGFLGEALGGGHICKSGLLESVNKCEG